MGARCLPSSRSVTATPRLASPRLRMQSANNTIEDATVKLGLVYHSLTTKIADSMRTTERIQATHRSHTAHGYHIEDIGGAELPLAPLLLPAPRSSILMRCRAMRSHTPDSTSCFSQHEHEAGGRR